MTKLGEYYAAALVDIARGLDAGITLPKDKLRQTLRSFWKVKASEEDINDAIRILNRCDISYVESDEFAGTFVVINERRFQRFMDRVQSEREQYDDIIRRAPDENLGISRAEETYFPYLNSYNTFKVLRKYSAFGNEWLRTAMDEIVRRTAVGEIEVPASDRVVRIDDNDPIVEEIKVAAAELRNRLTNGNDLGDIGSEQAQAVVEEVAQIESSFSKKFVRSSELISRSQKTLTWIAEKSAGTFVAQAATALFKLIMKFFGIPI
ncbi:hypothetical protein [Rhizorhapis sp. SPR117]|uniref:hypothetical protein n=1 Tax=Rhizorhapis sp. SPR117 TaxID=2912611 RepID=UPI001F2AC593|nr:hypothetical protein [Rhizorhapis sp. SPR117]